MKKSANGDPLRAKLASHLASGGSIAAFARQNADRSERTYERWSKEPDVIEQVRKHLAEMGESIRRRSTAGTVKAVRRLNKLLDNGDPKVQLGAARAMVALHLDVRDDEIDRRLRNLEDKATRAKQARKGR